ncbi:MAG: sporulation transcriptional regulator SpoIIID [Lachnospiraceae bacterium]|nr:sporulation transcriptional regulator SpoIIID [Lachnospiraceae bacterium]
MKDYIEERIISIAQYTIEHNSTVRSTAKKFGISKSTVHKDLRERLPKLNMELSRQVNKILDLNKSERHIRGGLATKRKYMHQTGK